MDNNTPEAFTGTKIRNFILISVALLLIAPGVLILLAGMTHGMSDIFAGTCVVIAVVCFISGVIYFIAELVALLRERRIRSGKPARFKLPALPFCAFLCSFFGSGVVFLSSALGLIGLFMLLVAPVIILLGIILGIVSLTQQKTVSARIFAILAITIPLLSLIALIIAIGNGFALVRFM